MLKCNISMPSEKTIFFLFFDFWTSINIKKILQRCFDQPEFTSHIHPLQAANCGHNSPLVVAENDLMWVANEIKILLLLKQFHQNFVLKTLEFRKLSHYSEMRNDALNASWGLKGLIIKFPFNKAVNYYSRKKPLIQHISWNLNANVRFLIINRWSTKHDYSSFQYI